MEIAVGHMNRTSEWELRGLARNLNRLTPPAGLDKIEQELR